MSDMECVLCRRPVEVERHGYEHPTCYACLSPSPWPGTVETNEDEEWRIVEREVLVGVIEKLLEERDALREELFQARARASNLL